MRKYRTLLAACLVIAFSAKAQENVIVELPEAYELSNIILALTEYGRTDKYEVQKDTKYYQDVLAYFEPVKNHPLLDSVNYSREKWNYYLAFRTDAYAFAFDKKNELKRVKQFYSMSQQLTPFDKHLLLINDFVKKSNFRKFYASKKDYYSHIVNNYKSYYYIFETKEYLDTKIGKAEASSSITKYVAVLSPLVFRMNCHRNIDEHTTADFVSASKDFIEGVACEDNTISRIIDNHTVFTEMDHGYVNPISDRYDEQINSNFKHEIWDKKSGYSGASSFNEYMTWAVYDLFLQDRFPEKADSISTQWQYQNASRGFFAQNLFSKKVTELYTKYGRKDLENIYKPLLEWSKEIEGSVTLPILTNVNTKQFIDVDTENIQLTFSEPMNTQTPFGIIVSECINNKLTGKKVIVKNADTVWSEDGKSLQLKLTTDYNEFVIFFNWWGIEKPLISQNGIFLQAKSYVMLKKKQ